jgi:transcriptional regulator GlxA family with amidase domain
MAMSPRNFARLFRGDTGETPARFTERVQADAARCTHRDRRKGMWLR